MILFIISLLILFIGVPLALLLVAQGARRGLAILVGFVGLVLVALSCITTIGPKNTGVISTFGAVSSRTLDAGPALKWPWQRVTDIDGTIQTDEYVHKTELSVRLGDGQTAKVWTTNRWRINPEAANLVYQDYRSDDPTKSFRDAVVSTQFKSAINDVLGDFNPTQSIDNVDTQNVNQLASKADFTPDYDSLSQQVEDKLASKVTKGDESLIEIVDVTISFIDYGAKTDQKINAFLGEVAKTRQALQAQATATAQAKANKILADSISRDPNVLVSRCLDLIAEGEASLPAGFQCWPNTGGAVVLPSGR